MRKKSAGRPAGPRRKHQPHVAAWADGPSPWGPELAGSTRVFWGPRLGAHPKWPGPIERENFAPRRQKGQRAGQVRGALGGLRAVALGGIDFTGPSLQRIGGASQCRERLRSASLQPRIRVAQPVDLPGAAR
jgi:hypothetical protein